jgi:hypothetical protein
LRWCLANSFACTALESLLSASQVPKIRVTDYGARFHTALQARIQEVPTDFEFRIFTFLSVLLSYYSPSEVWF